MNAKVAHICLRRRVHCTVGGNKRGKGLNKEGGLFQSYLQRKTKNLMEYADQYPFLFLVLRIDSCTHFNFRTLEFNLRSPCLWFYIRGNKCSETQKDDECSLLSDWCPWIQCGFLLSLSLELAVWKMVQEGNEHVCMWVLCTRSLSLHLSMVAFRKIMWPQLESSMFAETDNWI